MIPVMNLNFRLLQFILFKIIVLMFKGYFLYQPIHQEITNPDTNSWGFLFLQETRTRTFIVQVPTFLLIKMLTFYSSNK